LKIEQQQAHQSQRLNMGCANAKSLAVAVEEEACQQVVEVPVRREKIEQQ